MTAQDKPSMAAPDWNKLGDAAVLVHIGGLLGIKWPLQDLAALVSAVEALVQLRSWDGAWIHGVPWAQVLATDEEVIKAHEQKLAEVAAAEQARESAKELDLLHELIRLHPTEAQWWAFHAVAADVEHSVTVKLGTSHS